MVHFKRKESVEIVVKALKTHKLYSRVVNGPTRSGPNPKIQIRTQKQFEIVYGLKKAQ